LIEKLKARQPQKTKNKRKEKASSNKTFKGNKVKNE
jgi:hypothetical protein